MIDGSTKIGLIVGVSFLIISFLIAITHNYQFIYFGGCLIAGILCIIASIYRHKVITPRVQGDKQQNPNGVNKE